MVSTRSKKHEKMLRQLDLGCRVNVAVMSPRSLRFARRSANRRQAANNVAKPAQASPPLPIRPIPDAEPPIDINIHQLPAVGPSQHEKFLLEVVEQRA